MKLFAWLGCLALMFLLIFSVNLFTFPKNMKAYACTKWVIPKDHWNRASQKTKCSILSPVFPENGTMFPPNARHWVKVPKGKKKYLVMANLSWHSSVYWLSQELCLLEGTITMESIAFAMIHSMESPFHTFRTICQRFVFICNFIYKKKKGEYGYDPLFKVTYVLNSIMAGMRAVWVDGKKVDIDKSMIWYIGCVVAFV